jgi:hypothetical protein
MARERPSREKVFRVKPNMYMKEKAPMTAVGIAKIMLIVALMDFKKSQQTKLVKSAERRRFKTNSSTLARMN